MNKYRYQIFTLSVRIIDWKWWLHYISFKLKAQISEKMTLQIKKIYITQISQNFTIEIIFGGHNTSSVYGWGNTGLEKLNDFLKVIYLESGRN